MRPLLALPLLGLVLAGCAKGPGGTAVNQYTRLRFNFTMAGDVTTGDPPTFSSNYIYIVAIRPLFGNAPIDDGFGPVGVYSTTTGNPKNGFVDGRPTRYVIYDPTAPTAYRIRKFGTRTPTSDDDNPIDLAQISDVGTVVSGSDPVTSNFPRQLGFDIYTSDLLGAQETLMPNSTTAYYTPQDITAIQFNIIACNKALTSSAQASGRVADALGNINNLGVSGKGYRQVYINTSTGYTNAASSDPETSQDEYRPSSDYLPSVDIVDWTLDVSRPEAMPRVSILLTCYDHRRYLPAAVEGIRSQGFRDFETIALDDGSTDGSREWLADQPDLRCVFNAQNLGTYGTLNEGLKRATGELIAVLNDDDVWLPEKLERQVALLDVHPEVGLVHTGGGFIDGDGHATEGNPLGFRFPTFETGDILRGLVYENKIIASAALVRRECFDRVGWFDDSYFGSGDWEMWWRVCERYHAGFVDAPLTLYRVHGANASHRLERIWRDDERLREFVAGRIQALDGRIDAKAEAFNYAALGTVKMLNGKTAEARAAYRAALHLDSRRPQTLLRLMATSLGREGFKRTLRW